MAKRSLPLLLLGSGLFAACQLEASIQVVEHGATPDFVVTYDRGKAACVKGLTVSALDGDRRSDVWAIRRVDGAADALCRDRVIYGVVPAGYEAVVPAQPLRRARSYEVAATGTGWSATQSLAIR